VADLPVKIVATGRRGDDGLDDKSPASPFFYSFRFNHRSNCDIIVVVRRISLIFSSLNLIIYYVLIAALSSLAGGVTRDLAKVTMSLRFSNLKYV